MIDPGAILITGAAGSIGSALAKAYARPGSDLFLCDIAPVGLNRISGSCSDAGARVHQCVVDVTDRPRMAEWISEADSKRPLDLVIANAGVSYGNMKEEETEDQLRAAFKVNVDGTLNTIMPVLPRMRERRRGQIALMSSLAGLRGFPSSPSYCASKAAIRILGQGLRARLRPEGVTVSVIIPSFVKSPMTNANLFRMPWLLESDQAARVIREKLAKGKAEFIFPHPYPFLGWALSALPCSAADFITRITNKIMER